MYSDLKDKIVMVTGSGKRNGIGFAAIEKFAASGAAVIIADLGGKPTDAGGPTTGGRAEMDELSADIKTRFEVRTLTVEMDVSDPEAIERAAEKVKAEFGRLDVLVNNAGATFGVPNTIHNYDDGAWMKTMDVCLNSVFRVSKAFIPLMLESGGAVINTASRAGKVPPLFNGAYAVAKAGVIMTTKVMAKELAGNKIRVNAICPGQIMTDLEVWRFGLEAQLLGGTPEDREAQMCETIPLGRIGEAAETANVITFLASKESSYMTGQALNVTGGQLMEL